MPPLSRSPFSTMPPISRNLSLFVVLALLAACSKVSADESTKPTSPSAMQPRELPKVRTTPVRREDMQRVLETTAPVESVSEIDVVAEASARVLSVRVQEGQEVEQGALLARLDDRDQKVAQADASVAVAEAEAALERSKIAEQEAIARSRTAKLALDQAERDYKRNEELAAGEATNPLSAQAVEASRLARDNADEALKQARLAEERAAVDTRSAAAALERAKLTVERAARDLERTRITAPIAGVVATRSIEPGRNLTVGQVAFQLADLDHLRVVFYRPQRELDLFTGGEGLSLTATSEARPGFTFTGQIQRTSPTIDRASGAFRITAHLDPLGTREGSAEKARLLPGMLLRLFVVTGIHQDTLVAPKRAVRREGSNVYVLAVENGRIRKVPVTEGYSNDDDVELIPAKGAQLTPTTRIVLVGSRDLEDNDEVTDETPQAPSTPPGDPGPKAKEQE